MRKRFFILICIFMTCLNCCYGDSAVQAPEVQVFVSFTACQKNYTKPAEQLFYVLLSSLSKNNYQVKEIQSKNGLILFKSYNKEFLANITQVDNKTSHLKITPVDNNYNFSYYLLDNLFKTIEADLQKDIYKLN